MNVLPLVKSVVGLATSFGAGAVVGNAIKFTTPDNLKTYQKVLVSMGGTTLGFVAAELASDYVEKQIQEVADSIKIMRTRKVRLAVIVEDQSGDIPESHDTAEDSTY